MRQVLAAIATGIGVGLVIAAVAAAIIQNAWEGLQLGSEDMLEAAGLNPNLLGPTPSVRTLRTKADKLEHRDSGQQTQEMLRQVLRHRREYYEKCAGEYQRRCEMIRQHGQRLRSIAESLRQFESLWFGQGFTPLPPALRLDKDTQDEQELSPVETGDGDDESAAAVGDLQKIALASLRTATESYTRQLREDRQASEQLFQRLHEMVQEITRFDWMDAKNPPSPDDLGAPPNGASEVGITGRDVTEAMERARGNITSSHRNFRRAQHRTAKLIGWISAHLLPALDEALQHDQPATTDCLSAHNIAVIRPKHGTPVDATLHDGTVVGSAHDGDVEPGRILTTLKHGYRWQSGEYNVVLRKAKVRISR